MSFHQSALLVRVEDGHILKASLETADDGWHEAEIDLDTCLGNIDGKFTWGARDFSKSAGSVRVSVDEDHAPAILHATLLDSAGKYRDSHINLGDRIGNNEGNFEFKK